MIQALCFGGFGGVDTAMRHLEDVVGGIRHLTLADASGRSPEAAFVVAHVTETRPDLVLFGGWCPLYERLLEKLPKRVEVACWWPSSAGQVGLAAEDETLLAVLRSPRLREVFFVSRDLTDILGRPWLPATVSPRRCPKAAAARPADPPAIGLFCAADERARKNVTGCVLALGQVEVPFHLHLNGLSESPLHRHLLDELHIAYTEHGWMEADAYEALCARLTLGLQVSFAESHGFVVTEHLLRGVPVLASAMVPALEALPRDLREAMTATAPDSPRRVARQIERLLRGEGLRDDWRARARKAVLHANRRAIAQARKTLAPWC